MFHGDTRSTTSANQAQALEYFEQFINAASLKNILGYFRTMCDLLHLKSTYFPLFYPKLKASLNSWKAKAIWKKLDSRAVHKCYGKGRIGEKTRVLIIGAGPCGLRAAIEAQLLGCKVVVVEKRDRLSRNNVLHLWPFVIEDLRALGAKKFFGKFCAGAIDHISIRQLQCILLKVALILGVEIHTEVSFESLIEPDQDEKIGWRAQLKPSNHPVAQYEFDVIIGADGKRNTLTGFKRKEFRGKLAIAITANFINKRTEAEARVEEISGVAFIFNQKFFKDLYHETGIDLENIVYYKDDTHYFVMTAKKASLIEKGVILQDLADTERLLAPDNVNREALLSYAREAADFSTNYQMPDVEFAVNHYGQPDVAMFDFTSMYAAENASKVVERNGYQLLMMLVGDSLLEPFWPTGSGCARGFLSSLDAAWAIRSWSLGKASPLEVMAERESIYRLLAQTTPDNLNKDWKSYTLDPSSRYPNLNRTSVAPHQLISLYDTDDVRNIEKMGGRMTTTDISTVSRKRRRDVVDGEILIDWVKRQLKTHSELEVDNLVSIFRSGKILCAIINHYRPDLIDFSSLNENEAWKNNQIAMDILEKDIGIPPIMTAQEITNSTDTLALTAYLTQIYDVFRSEIPHVKHPKLELPEPKNMTTNFRSLLRDPTSAILSSNITQRNPNKHRKNMMELANKNNSGAERKGRKRKTLDKSGNVEYENKIPSLVSGRGNNADEEFAAKIKSIEENWQGRQIVVEKKPKDLMRKIGKIETSDWNIREIEKKIQENKLGKPIVRDREKVPKWSREQFVARQTKLEKLDRQDSAEAKYADIDKNIKHLDLKLKEGTNRDLGQNKVATITEKLVSKVPEQPPVTATIVPKNDKPVIMPSYSGSEYCHFCTKRVYLMERLSAEGRFFHHNCFKCQYCKAQLRLGSYAFDKDGIYGHKFFCLHHYGMQGEAPNIVTKLERKSSSQNKSPTKKPITGISGVDLLDRVQTPERVEFSNLSRGSSDQEDLLSQMDEDEWTDRNFGASTVEIGSSDDDDDGESSSYSETDSEDDEEIYEEAAEEPATKEGTLKWAERMSKRHYPKRNKSDDSDPYGTSDSSSYYENSSDDDDSDTATEGEDEVLARELRLQEVRLKPPIIQADTGTDTEVLSDDDDDDSEKSGVQNSATEISTDSEFQDDPTPTSEIPAILLNDLYIDKTERPKKIQVTGGFLQKPFCHRNIELKLTPLKRTPIPTILPTTTATNIGNQETVRKTELPYALNRTQSTGGIATKVSLELKKKYLLGGDSGTVGGGVIQKSGSASTLDTKLKTFCSNITDCQKLLKPATEMQTISKKIEEQLSPIKVQTVTLDEVEEKEKIEEKFENENEGRPRSPPHETSLIVPEMNWESKSISSSNSSSCSDVAVETKETVQMPETPFVDSIKSMSGEKKELNQPKTLPGLLQTGYLIMNDDEENSESGNSTPVSGTTELSDWARDGNNVSDFEVGAFDENKPKIEHNLNHICGRGELTINQEQAALNSNFDSLEFMDTESYSEEESIGYNLLKNDEILLDSLEVKNSGYCEIGNVETVATVSTIGTTNNNFGGEVIDLKSNDLEILKKNQNLSEREEDSLIVIETNMTNTNTTTTEENSDSTVKNVTEIPKDDNKKRFEEKLSQIKKEKEEFETHCQRLRTKIEFGNVKDSIDVRKLRRKSKEDENLKDITLNLTNLTIKTPEQIYKKEIIEHERNVNQRLVQEMVMSKMKLLESKRKNRKVDGVIVAFGLQKSQTTPDIVKNDETVVEKLRNEARARVKMLTNEELGLSPEEKMQKLREKYTEFKLYPSSTTSMAPVQKFRPLSEYSKFDENTTGIVGSSCRKDVKLCRSDSNLNKKDVTATPKKGLKFTKIMDLFSKKSPKGLFSKISPKSKEKMNKDNRVKSFPENLGRSSSPDVPPPVPPLPSCYTEQMLKNSEESSDDDFRSTKRNSCETLDGLLDDSTSSLAGKTQHQKRVRRSVREAQLKRHRMAQEIQRKLEETEVKTRELEERGVVIEKTLRGENNQQNGGKQESELLQEWFDIMRDRTELRRYEKELMVRAQELELEDRHARLQHQLRKRLREEKKTEQDKETDYKIINEMLEIVAKRDSLIRLLEEDRLRYLNEDRDFEEQMLAKDLHLTTTNKVGK